MKNLIEKHLGQIRKDFNVPKGCEPKADSELRSWTRAEIIELPETLFGLGRPYLSIKKASEDIPGELNVELRVKIDPRGKTSPSYDVILETRTY